MFKIVYSVLVYLQFKTLDQLKEQSRGKDNLYCKKTKYCISLISAGPQISAAPLGIHIEISTSLY